MANEFDFYSTESNILEKSKEKTGTLQNRLSQQIKSKERVASRGEVFTAEREVKAMCDLVKDECERIDSRFLEPACGNGNFLAEILGRKLAVVTKKYAKNPVEWKKNSFIAVSSLYGIDIMSDNAAECRQRLFSLWEAQLLSIAQHKNSDEDLKKSIEFILSKNICVGNALTLKTVDEAQKDTKNEIIFSEWSFIGDMLKRRDFSFNALVNQEYFKEAGSLFGDMESESSEEDREVFLPVKEFPLIAYWRVYEQSV